MKDIILLTKILFKSSLNKNKKNGKEGHSLGKIVLFTVLYAYLAGIVGYISYEAISSLMEINQEAVFFNICFVGMIGMTIIQTVFNSLNILFFSKDIEYLMPLPISPIKIIMAKFNCLIISSYIINAIVVLPVLVVYAVLLKLGIAFYIVGLLVLLLFPIMPVILTSIIVTIIMKFTNIIRNKDMVQYLTVFITLIFVIGIQIFSSSGSSDTMTNEELANMLIETNGLVELYSDYFITLKPINNALLNYNNFSGIINLLILFLESGVVYIVGGIITAKMYINAVTSLTTQGIKKSRKISKDKDYKEKTLLKSYVKKEFINLTRNPIFFMQCMLPSILFPILFSFPIFVSLKEGGEEGMLGIQNMISQNIETSRGIIVSLAVIAFCFMFNFIAVTSVSRDRNNSVFMKYIPVNLEKQCLYKTIPGMTLNMIPLIYFLVVIKIIVPIISIKIVLYILLTSILMNIFDNYCFIIVDLTNPKLEWITEYAVVKQNVNMFFQFVIILLQFGIIGLIALKITNIEILVAIISLIYILGMYLIRKYVTKNQVKLFSKIV